MDVNNIEAGEDSNGGAGNNEVAIVAAVVTTALLLFTGFVMACYCRLSRIKSSISRAGAWNLQSQVDTDTSDSTEKDFELGDNTGSTTLARAPTLDTSTSEEVAAVADASGQQHRGDRKTRILTHEESLRRAKFFFPGLLKDTMSLSFLKSKYKRAPHWGCVYAALQTELSKGLHYKLSQLRHKESEKFERLMKRENAEELCIELGMNPDVVNLRFQVIHNFGRELEELNIGIKLGKTHILHSLRHLIDTIHVTNPFGEEEHIDAGTIINPYRKKEWLSYLGVRWPKDEIGETVERVESILSTSTDPVIKNFYVRGTSGRELQENYENNGDLWVSQNTPGFKHDFGTGVYCFKNETRWALSFAIDRCWPTVEDPHNAGKAIVGSSNPALVIFPKPNHGDIKNYKFEVGQEQKPITMQTLEPFENTLREDDNYDEFIRAREKWKNDKNKLGYWKDYVKLSLCYGVDLVASQGHRVLYGLMHDCNEGMRPLGEKEPVPDKDGWIQYCFKENHYQDLLLREEEMLFVEFCVDWKDWLAELHGKDGATKKQRQKMLEQIQKNVQEQIQ